MLPVNILNITSYVLFHMQYNNQDDSSSFTSSNAENKSHHPKGMPSTELVNK